MTEKEFFTKYLDPEHLPADHSLKFILEDSGLPEQKVLDLIAFARQVVSSAVYSAQTANLATILAAWDLAHPAGFYRHTPFGTDILVPLAELKSSDLTVEQLHDVIVDAVRAAK